MKTRRWKVATVVLVLFVCAGVLAGAVRAAQNVPKAPAEKAAVEAAPQEIHPTFLTPRERSAIPVFLGWTWLSIGVLLYFLRLKVREADRVYLTGLYEDTNGHKEPPTP
jgi:hypothetical protein